MKKLIAIILCLFCYSASEARNLMVVGGGVPVAGGCSTATEIDVTPAALQGGSDEYSSPYLEGTNNYKLGAQFSPSANIYITGYRARILDNANANVGSAIFSIQTESGGFPTGTVVTGSDVTVAASTVTSTLSDFVVNLPAAIQLTSGTQYFFVVTGSGASGTSIYYEFDSTAAGKAAVGWDGSWHSYADFQMIVKLYGCNP
jgi:hypothetical protein